MGLHDPHGQLPTATAQAELGSDVEEEYEDRGAKGAGDWMDIPWVKKVRGRARVEVLA